MVVLRKIKSATLVEALIATVLIVIVFVIASMVLNNLLFNTFSKNTHPIEYRLNELEYNLENGALKMPYEESYKGWDIVISKETIKSQKIVCITATNGSNSKEVSRKRIYDQK